MAFGETTSFFPGLVAVAFPANVLVIAGKVLLASAHAGVGVGAWLSGLVGMSVENSIIKELESAVKAGEILVLLMYQRFG